MQIGPLTFPAVLDDVSEPLGDGFEQAGAVVVAAERRARSLNLKLAVRAADDETGDAREAGMRLRRQLRQLAENTEWRKYPMPITWDIDPDMDAWVILDTGDLAEAQAGLTFGEFVADLNTYLVGRPGTHRIGRRLDLADRRDGTIARDTFGTIYSTDFASAGIPSRPLILPGDITGLLGSAGIPDSSVLFEDENGRALARNADVDDGDVVSYVADASIGDEHGLYVVLDEPGSVKVWDTQTAGAGAGSVESDSTLAALHGWERVYGPTLTPTRPLAVGNDMCRVMLLANGRVEYSRRAGDWGTPPFAYSSVSTLDVGSITETSVIECTPERVVIEFRTEAQRARVILQRGWCGPRVEVLSLTSDPAWLHAEDVLPDDTVYDAVWTLYGDGVIADISPVCVAISHAAVTVTDYGDDDGTRFEADRSLAVQIDSDPLLTIMQRSLVDARAVPVLVAR